MISSARSKTGAGWVARRIHFSSLYNLGQSQTNPKVFPEFHVRPHLRLPRIKEACPRDSGSWVLPSQTRFLVLHFPASLRALGPNMTQSWTAKRCKR